MGNFSMALEPNARCTCGSLGAELDGAVRVEADDVLAVVEQLRQRCDDFVVDKRLTSNCVTLKIHMYT